MTSRRLNLASNSAIAAVATGIVLVLTGAIATAAIPTSTTAVIYSCYSVKTGTLRVIDYQHGKRCSSAERLLKWNQRGATGAAGVRGPQGYAGSTGTPGQTGAQGPKGDAGAMGQTGPQGPKGDTGAQGPKGDPGTPPAPLVSWDDPSPTTVPAFPSVDTPVSSRTFTLDAGTFVTGLASTVPTSSSDAACSSGWEESDFNLYIDGIQTVPAGSVVGAGATGSGATGFTYTEWLPAGQHTASLVYAGECTNGTGSGTVTLNDTHVRIITVG